MLKTKVFGVWYRRGAIFSFFLFFFLQNCEVVDAQARSCARQVGCDPTSSWFVEVRASRAANLNAAEAQCAITIADKSDVTALDILLRSLFLFPHQTEDYLKRKIRSRPERSELVRMHILEGEF